MATGLTFYNADQVAYAAIARLFSTDLDVLNNAILGYHVLCPDASATTSCQVVAGTSAGTVKVSAGYAMFSGGTQRTVSVQDNLAVTVDATRDRFAYVEIDGFGSAGINLGAAAANPEPPTPTAGNLVVARLYIPAGSNPASGADTLVGTANGKIKIQDFRVIRGIVDIQGSAVAGAFTWTKPRNARWSRLFLFGAGGGGGSGRCGAGGSKRLGGSGGGGGGRGVFDFDPSGLTSQTVTVGTGGTGGAAAGTGAANGADGTDGTATTFGIAWTAGGGIHGVGGAAAAVQVGGAGATAASANGLGTQGGSQGDGTTAPTAGGAGTVAASSGQGPSGGGGGGGLPTGNGEQVGAAGGLNNPHLQLSILSIGAAGTVHGNGGDGTDPGITLSADDGGYGGGGGGSSNSNTVNGGNGGNGKKGGGGGGGGAGTSGNTAKSGRGGNGGDGAALIVTWCD